MMAGQIVSPNNSMKIKNINAARRIKNGSPKIREVLRQVRKFGKFLLIYQFIFTSYNLNNFQRCRQRIHERRDEIFSKRRLGLDTSEDIKNTLTDIVHQEFNNISANMEWSMTANSELNSFKNSNEVLGSQDEIFDIEETIEGSNISFF